MSVRLPSIAAAASFTVSCAGWAQPAASTDPVETFIDAYRAENRQATAAALDPDVVVANYPGQTRFSGREAFLAYLDESWAQYDLDAIDVIARIDLGGRIIVHSRLTPSGPEAAPFELADIFTVNDGRIVRIETVAPSSSE